MKLNVVLIFMIFLVSCVGTVEKANKPKTDTTKAPIEEVIFYGVHSVVPIAHDKIDVFFYPGVGGSENYDYIIYYGGFPFPKTIPSEVLEPDYRGLLKYTLSGLNQAEPYQVRMDVQDQKSGYTTATNVIKETSTFDNRVCDFSGIGNVANLAGVDGLDSISVRWPHADKDYGSITGDLSSDPISYEVVVLDSNLLTPESFDNFTLTTAQGRYVKFIEYSIMQNETVFRGLPSATRFYVRVRAIHKDTIEDQTQPQLRSELNSDYMIIETLNNDASLIDWDTNGVEVNTLSGEDQTRAVVVQWPTATGVFDHYRLYFAEDGVIINNGTMSSQCVSGEEVGGIYCKKISFSGSDTLIANLEPSKTYNFQLVICRTSVCEPFDRILAVPKQATTFPSLAPFGGLESIEEAGFVNDLGSIFLRFSPPNFSEGWVDGLIVGVKYTTDPDPSYAKITEIAYTGDLDVQPFDYTIDNSLEVKGIEYNANKLYCFTIYPFIYDEFDQKVEFTNDAWTCVIPTVTAPTYDEFIGAAQAYSSGNNMTVIWNSPTRGVFDEYEIFYKKTPGDFSFSQAVYETTVLYDFTNYERQVLAGHKFNHTFTNVANGNYQIGVVTHFLDFSGSVRSQYNEGIYECNVQTGFVNDCTLKNL